MIQPFCFTGYSTTPKVSLSNEARPSKNALTSNPSFIGTILHLTILIGLLFPDNMAFSKVSNIFFFPIEVRSGSLSSTVVCIGTQTSEQIPKSIVIERCMGCFLSIGWI